MLNDARLQRSHAAAELIVRTSGAEDAAALAALRAQWSGGEDADLERRMADWLAAEGERRTTWLATVAGAPAGMASMFEYRRMPTPGARHPGGAT